MAQLKLFSDDGYAPGWSPNYYQSHHWKSFRTGPLERDGHRCVICNRKATQVHHRTYERLWNEQISDCYSLCDKCHEINTQEIRRRRAA